MNKIDLIIDALENAVHNFAGDDTEEKCIAALAAAHELKALKPVAWKYDWYGYKSQNETKVLIKDWIASVYSEMSDPTINAHNIRPLYALDGEQS